MCLCVSKLQRPKKLPSCTRTGPPERKTSPCFSSPSAPALRAGDLPPPILLPLPSFLPLPSLPMRPLLPQPGCVTSPQKAFINRSVLRGRVGAKGTGQRGDLRRGSALLTEPCSYVGRRGGHRTQGLWEAHPQGPPHRAWQATAPCRGPSAP